LPTTVSIRDDDLKSTKNPGRHRYLNTSALAMSSPSFRPSTKFHQNVFIILDTPKKNIGRHKTQPSLSLCLGRRSKWKTRT